MNTRARPWKVILLRGGLTYDTCASYSTEAAAERGLERLRERFKKGPGSSSAMFASSTRTAKWSGTTL